MRGKLVVLICLLVMVTGWGVSGATDDRAVGTASSGGQKLSTKSVFNQEFCRRESWSGNLGHYVYSFRVGKGPYDRIVVHRLVTETTPGKPARISKGVFLIHGDASGFACFLQNPDDSSLAAHLAGSAIDVWGIDLRWNSVSSEVTDHEFMKNWNTRTHLSDISLAIKFARLIRLVGGSGKDKLNVLGFSTGGYLALALANEEAVLPTLLRDIKGLIPMDVVFKAAPDAEEIRGAAAGRHAIFSQMVQAGVYSSSEGQNIQAIAGLALAQPDDPSPVVPGLTNFQAAIFINAATWMTVEPPAGPYTPFFHYAAGIFSQEDLPLGLQFIPEGRLLNYALTVPAYQSLGELLEQDALLAEIGDSPFDNNLGRISVPVLYVGAAGGAGDYGRYTLDLLGGSDKQVHVVRQFDVGYEAVDFGHFDLLMADNAAELVWNPILNWLKTH